MKTVEFLGKAYAYQHTKENVVNLPPIRLEILLDEYYKQKDKSGYHVPKPVHLWMRRV